MYDRITTALRTGDSLPVTAVLIADELTAKRGQPEPEDFRLKIQHISYDSGFYAIVTDPSTHLSFHLYTDPEMIMVVVE